MNLLNLITESQRLAGRVDSNFNDRSRRWLNEAQTEWVQSVPWPTLVRTETFACDGTAQLVLPPRVLTVKWLLDRTNKRPVAPNDQLDKEYAAPMVNGTAGNIDYWKEYGVVPVARQPAATGKLSLYTTASDSFSFYVAGLVENTAASGTAEQYYYVQETVVVSTTGTYQTANNYVRVDVLGKDDFTNGDVVVTDASSNLLARIPQYAYQSEYKVLQFVLVPTAGTLVDVAYIQRPPPLVDNAQQPPPAVDTEYLIWYAAGMLHQAQPGQEQAAATKLARAAEILQRRIAKEKKHGDKDWRGIPDPSYWGSEDYYEIPHNSNNYGW